MCMAAMGVELQGCDVQEQRFDMRDSEVQDCDVHGYEVQGGGMLNVGEVPIDDDKDVCLGVCLRLRFRLFRFLSCIGAVGKRGDV